MISQETIKATITNYFEANNTLDVERFINAFTSDASIYYAGPVSPLTGPDALRQVAEQSLLPFSRLQATINRILYSEDGAAIYYTAQLTVRDGRAITTDGIDIMEITTEGKIQSIRFYMDAEALQPLFQ